MEKKNKKTYDSSWIREVLWRQRCRGKSTLGDDQSYERHNVWKSDWRHCSCLDLTSDRDLNIYEISGTWIYASTCQRHYHVLHVNDFAREETFNSIPSCPLTTTNTLYHPKWQRLPQVSVLYPLFLAPFSYSIRKSDQVCYQGCQQQDPRESRWVGRIYARSSNFATALLTFFLTRTDYLSSLSDKPAAADKPKREPSAYQIFCKENMKKWNEENPGRAKEAMTQVSLFSLFSRDGLHSHSYALNRSLFSGRMPQRILIAVRNPKPGNLRRPKNLRRLKRRPSPERKRQRRLILKMRKKWITVIP